MEEKTNFYRFRNTRTDYRLRPHFEVGNTNEGYHVYQSPIEDREREKYDWLMIPTGTGDNFFIVNKYSGFALFAAMWGRDPDDHRVFVAPLTYTGDDKESNIRSFFWRQPENPGPIINYVSGYALFAGDWGKYPDNVHVYQAPRSYNDGDPRNDQAFIWERYVQGELPRPPEVYEDDKYYLPRLDSLDPPKHFASHIARTSYVPCWMVDDPENDFQWKMKHSPYYTLERRQRYSRIDYTINTTDQAIEDFEAELTSGWSKATSETFSITTAIATTVETEGGIPGLGTVAVSMEISLELGYEKANETTYYEELKLRPKVPSIPPGAVGAIYGIENEFTLRRADGTYVKPPWVVKDKDGFIPLVYSPPEQT